ncbi:MAG: DUF2334 domain-containing protein [Deltaproteobacteria bacterium]|nr:DUF2334 domain-containing protein [Deltaproteobacteria bacterium]
MTIVLVRDDDANATTRPERLEQVYAPLLDAHIPVNFAIIPEVGLDTRAPDGSRERFIDEEAPDSPDARPLTSESPLACWLRRHQGQVDVLVHGLSHRRRRNGTELGSLTFDEAVPLLTRAIELSTAALHRTPIGFVPPWDVMSNGSLRAASAWFDLVSLGWVDRTMLPVAAWPAHLLERMARREALRVGRAWVVRHRGGRIGPHTPPQHVEGILQTLTEGADICVVQMHHWMFWSEGEAHPVIRALADALRTRTTVDVRDAVRALDNLPAMRIPRIDRWLGDVGRGTSAGA